MRWRRGQRPLPPPTHSQHSELCYRIDVRWPVWIYGDPEAMVSYKAEVDALARDFQCACEVAALRRDDNWVREHETPF